MENYAESINQRVESIKGNNDEIDRLIREYKPFIASIVESCVGRYVRYGEDDELSVGLIAFEESIRTFDISKGNFLAFARNVIKRRLIDYYRKESKNNNTVPLIESCGDTEDHQDEFDLSAGESIKIHTEAQVAEYRRAEIEELKAELEKWGISFFDVAKSSPKQEGTRRLYKDIVNTMIQNTELLETMKKKRYLPVAEIEKSTKIPRKKIERARNYIIAAVMVLSGDYQYLKSFIDWR